MANGRVSDITRMTEAGTTVIFNREAKMPRQKYYPQISTEIQEPKLIGLYDTLGDLTAAEVKAERDTISFDSIGQGYQTTITSQTISKGVDASREKLEYDLYKTVNRSFGAPMIRVMLQKKEKAIADLYNDGFATTTGADGVYIFSATHPLLSSAEHNNNLATGALTTDNLIAGKNKFLDIKDQAGGQFDTRATTLLINDHMQYRAMQILESQLVAFELSNTKNVANSLNPVRVVSNPYIDFTAGTGGAADTSPWFLIDDSLEDAGAILQTKKSIWLETEWLKSSQVYRGMCFEMYGTGMISPGYRVVGSTGA